MTDDPFREFAGAYVLGALEPGDRVAFEDHLDDCERCRADVVSFSPLPGLLAGIDEADTAPVDTDVSAELIAAVAADQGELRRSRARWRRAAVGVAVAAVLAVLATVAIDDDDPAEQADDRVELTLTSDYAAHGFIAVAERPWGSSILIDLFDMPQRDGYTMWSVSRTGEWREAANWAWSEDGTCGLLGSVPHLPDEIDRIVIGGRADKGDAVVIGRFG